VKTAPHFGHFNLLSLATPAQPKEKANNTATARARVSLFFTPLHLLSSERFTYEQRFIPLPPQGA
jgi:hypothetical protein